MGLWRRKHSGSSGESSSSNTSGTVTPVTSSEEPELNSKRSVRLMKSLTNGLRSSNKPKKADHSEMTPLEQRINRPLTQRNLEHHRMFDDFTFDFGKRKQSYGGHSVISGISPCASRRASIDSNYAPHSSQYHSHHHHHGDRRDTHHSHFHRSLAGEVHWEVSGEESDKESRRRAPPTGAFSDLSL